MVAMRQVARVHSVFTPALIRTMGTHPGDLRLRLAPTARPWIFRRLAHGHRVSIIEGDAPADFEIQPDGSLRPLP